MAKSPDHPELNFVQAAGYTKGRPDGPPLWIVIHDMEAGESSTRAESTAAYFAAGADGRQVSSHYTVDNDSVIQCVLLKDVAWTVGNRPGNNRGINWELAGYARQSRAEWLDAFGLAMFARMAPYVRADAAKFGIPLRRCTVADLKAFRPGITSHNDLRLAFGVTTHTDVGPNFPWDVFLQMMEDDVNLTDRVSWPNTKIRDRMVAAGWSATGLTVAELLTYTFERSGAASAQVAKLDEILAAARDDGNVTVQLPPEYQQALVDLKSAIAAVPEAVADEAAQRLVD